MRASSLDRLIEPEIKDDAFCAMIKSLASTQPSQWVLEIGSSSGEGSTRAFIEGLSENLGTPTLFCVEISKPRFEKLQKTYGNFSFVQCYNGSTVSIEEFPTVETVQSFYNNVESGLNKYPLASILDWRRQDLEYIQKAGVETDIIGKIKSEHGIETFDMVLIDGSEFTGRVEFEKVKGAKFILLDDTNTFKCYEVRQALLKDSMYDLIADDQTRRNGYSVFQRRETPRKVGQTLPINFFTIVLNGEPFIRYHEEVFRQLTVPWHWHVVEGVAALKHDTSWSVATGGFVDDSVHNRGRSKDGTSEYLDEVVRRFPDNVSLYRKPLDEFWEGKVEMVNAPLAKINEECLLWQIDSDELWTPSQIHAVHDQFTQNPDRTSAYYWCWYFVGPEKIVSTRYNYSQNPAQEWLRTWRYTPGMFWAAHEPPTLISEDDAGNQVDVAALNAFTHDEMEQIGAVFQHFAYVTRAQLAFKESYYGYKDATAQWTALQTQQSSGQLKDFFSWVTDLTMFDDSYHYVREPIARLNPNTERWTFCTNALPKPAANCRIARPRILVDGLFWQYAKTGIARVWDNLLREWADTDFSDHVIVLDRAGTAPRIPGVHYFPVKRHDYLRTGSDSLYLESICRRLDADLFVSTYYSTPTETPSFFCGHDMIPEVLGMPMVEEPWREKRRAILHASGHSMVSQNSANDLERLYPHLQGNTHVALNGLGRSFFAPTGEEIEHFRAAYDLSDNQYVLLVGERHGYGGYKNSALAFQALAMLPEHKSLTLICVGGPPEIEPDLLQLAPNLEVRRVAPSDDELRAAYGGAHALLYPSKYEGFGLPPLEAMACGTPVIVCAKGSIPEVVGDAGLYVDEDDPSRVRDILVQLYDPKFRANLIALGFEQAKKFSISRTAAEMRDAILATCQKLEADELASPLAAVWSELRRVQSCEQELATVARSDVRRLQNREEELAAAQALIKRLQLRLERNQEHVRSIQNSPFWKARERVIQILKAIGYR